MKLETDMYADDETDDNLPRAQPPWLAALQNKGSVHELEISGKKVMIADAARVIRLETTIKNLTAQIARLETSLQTATFNIRMLENGLRRANVSLDTKVGYE